MREFYTFIPNLVQSLTIQSAWNNSIKMFGLGESVEGTE